MVPSLKSNIDDSSGSATKNKLTNKSSSSVITVRINDDLNRNLDKLKDKIGNSKADLIRNYLDMSRYVIKHKNSIKSYDNRDLIIIKKSFLRKVMEESEEENQIQFGDKMARFVNDIARINGKLNDLEFKLDFCDNLGFFPKFIDDDNYILISNKFGPKKFVESFIFRLITENEFDINFTEEGLKTSRTLSAYKKTIQPVDRSSSHYSFEFAKLEE